MTEPSYQWRRVNGRPMPRSWYGPAPTPYVTVDTDDWAHGVWTAVAVTLAEPLRKALTKHIDTHRCSPLCGEAMRLFALLPEGDKIILA